MQYKMKDLIIKMPRVKAAINFSFFICLLFYHSTIHSQGKLFGKYTVIGSDSKGSSLTFLKNGEFQFTAASGDLGKADFGAGTYIYTDQKLILNFNRTALTSISSYSHFQIWKNNKDFVEMNVTVADIHGIPIPGANVFCTEFKIVQQTNSEGTCTLILPKKMKETEIKVLFIGLKESRTLVNLNLNYKLKVFLSEGELEGIPILNQSDTLNVISVNRTNFKIKNKDGEIIIWKKQE